MVGRQSKYNSIRIAGWKFLFFGLLLCLQPAFAQHFSASADKTEISKDETVTISFSTDAEGHAFQPPSFNGFEVISGPNQTTSVTLINNHFSRSLSYSFELRPLNSGTLVIGPASIKIGNRELTTTPVKIIVSDGRASQANTGNSSIDVSSDGNLFIAASTDKKQYYEGEAIPITWRVYFRNANIENFIETKGPSFTGFWVENGKIPSPIQTSVATVHGKRYSVGIIKQSIVFSRNTGEMTIEPLEVECTGEKIVHSEADDFFNGFPGAGFFNDFEPFREVLRSSPLKISVIPLPVTGKPDDFSGFVGNANVSASLDQQHVKNGEPFNMKISIGGEGNLNLIEPFEIKLPGADVFPAGTNSQVNFDENHIKGIRTFNYSIVPRQEGNLIIDPLRFSYFDPLQKKYIITVTKPFKIEVEHNPDYKPHSQDKPEPAGNPATITTENKYRIAIYSLGGVALFSIVLIALLARRKKEGPPHVSEQPAVQSIQTMVENAESLAATDKSDEFYSAVLDTIYTFLEREAMIPQADANREQIRSILAARNFDEKKIATIIRIIDQCEYARYAPRANSEFDKKALFEDLRRTIL